MVGVGSKVYKTSNSGNNWELQYNNGMCGLYSVYFVNDLTGWTSGCEGVIHKTTNGGTNWMIQSIASTSFLYSIRFVNPLTGWAVGAGGKILKTTSGGITSIKSNGSEIPAEFLLLQNYPNPFNPATTIKFDIAASSFVNLRVYNILGKEIEVLVNEQMNPGSYNVDWDASNYPSGVYIYKMISGNFIQTKKMILIK